MASAIQSIKTTTNQEATQTTHHTRTSKVVNDITLNQLYSFWGLKIYDKWFAKRTLIQMWLSQDIVHI